MDIKYCLERMEYYRNRTIIAERKNRVMLNILDDVDYMTTYQIKNMRPAKWICQCCTRVKIANDFIYKCEKCLGKTAVCSICMNMCKIYSTSFLSLCNNHNRHKCDLCRANIQCMDTIFVHVSSIKPFNICNRDIQDIIPLPLELLNIIRNYL